VILHAKCILTQSPDAAGTASAQIGPCVLAGISSKWS
jgi:hypothetical protein